MPVTYMLLAAGRNKLLSLIICAYRNFHGKSNFAKIGSKGPSGKKIKREKENYSWAEIITERNPDIPVTGGKTIRPPLVYNLYIP